MVQVLSLSIFPGAMVLTALMDLFTMTIPNRISLLLVAGFFALAPFVGLSAEQIMWHAATGAAMLALSFLMFWRGWIGGGDAKIFSAIALWLGFAQLGQFVGYAAVAGGLLTVFLLGFRRIPAAADADAGRLGDASAQPADRRPLRHRPRRWRR